MVLERDGALLKNLSRIAESYLDAKGVTFIQADAPGSPSS